jgi:N-acetylneuraminic acid mutarotase
MYLSNPQSDLKTVTKNNKILFFASVGAPTQSTLDMYDIATNTWSIVVLPATIEGASIISVNDTVYIAGGKVNGVLSDKVWKLEF